MLSLLLCRFQSTPPVKAATSEFVATLLLSAISIHAAREGGDEINDRQTFGHWISIHAAREGGDASSSYSNGVSRISIHAAREGGDVFAINQFGFAVISIHAAREGGDQRTNRLWQFDGDFNPRRP